MPDHQALVDALVKFQEWCDEYEEVKKWAANRPANDAIAELLLTLYGTTEETTHKIIGGSNAPILRDATVRIRELVGLLRECDGLVKQLVYDAAFGLAGADEEKLHAFAATAMLDKIRKALATDPTPRQRIGD